MSYFTIKKSLFIVPSQTHSEEYKKLDVYLSILEKSGIGEIIATERRKTVGPYGGRIGYNPYNLMATVIYCFAMFKASLRDIEDKCKFDLRVIYLMEQKMPNYVIICEFINRYILPYSYEIFSRVTKTFIKEFNIDIDNQYIDGSKIEANANKYKFVWKPTTFHKKLDEKIKIFIKNNNFSFIDNRLIKSHEFRDILNNYVKEQNIDKYNLPMGKGIKLTEPEKIYKTGYDYLLKLIEYEEKERICGENRNSYYKTDYDATAMVLKQDYYSSRSHDFHASYNIQLLISSGIITMYGVYQDRSDYYTLIPLLNKYYEYYGEYPKNLVGDSGYGIHVNYKFLREKQIGNYLKFQQWTGESSGKRPQLFFVDKEGNVTCLNNKQGEIIEFEGTHQRNKEGKLFIFKGCRKCGYSYKCKKKLKRKSDNFRKIELIPDYELLKKEARQNLLSPKGIEMRINRSIQAEGAFGQIKENMKYVRIRRRKIDRVSNEIMLMCLGRNIRKLFSILSGNEIKDNYWDTPNDLEEEIFPKVKPKEKRTVRN